MTHRMKYKVEITIVDMGTSTALFNTKEQALDACYLFFTGVDFPNRYSNCNFLERALKTRNCPQAGIDSSLKDWYLSISKVML